MMNSSCTGTGVADNIVLHAILHTKSANKVILTYAFYDNGSSGFLMTEEFYSLFQARGNGTRLQLCRIHGSSSSSTVVEDLMVSSMDNENRVELRKACTCRKKTAGRRAKWGEIWAYW